MKKMIKRKNEEGKTKKQDLIWKEENVGEYKNYDEGRVRRRDRKKSWQD